MKNTIYSIQFLRGFAAALVLLTHVRLETGLSMYGGAGVDLFFVISGFVIYFVTESDKSNFLIKRVIRVVPLYWLATFCVAAVAIAAPSLLKNAEFSLQHLLLSLFFVPHWTTTQEFQPLLGLGWTLNFEMMFYLLFAIAMRISHRHRFEIASSLVVALMLLATLAVPEGAGFGLEFYKSPLMLEFIIGMAIAKAFLAYRNQFSTSQPFLMISLSMVSFLLMTAVLPFDDRILDHGLIAAFLLAACLAGEALFASKGWLKRLSVISGEMSYSLYLLHIYVLAVLSRLLHLEGWMLWVLSFTLIPALAWLTYHTVELTATRMLRRLVLARPVQQPPAPQPTQAGV